MDDQKRHTVKVYKLHITIYFWKANKKVNLQKMKKKNQYHKYYDVTKRSMSNVFNFFKTFFRILKFNLASRTQSSPKKLKVTYKKSQLY